MKLRIYTDTSVLGGCQDDEFRDPSRHDTALLESRSVHALAGGIIGFCVGVGLSVPAMYMLPPKWLAPGPNWGCVLVLVLISGWTAAGVVRGLAGDRSRSRSIGE